MSKRPSGLRGNSPDFGRGMSLAFEFAGAVFLFWLIGRFLDNRLGIEPWGQVTGAVIGWVGGFLHVYYRTKGVAWQGVPGSRQPAPFGRGQEEQVTRSAEVKGPGRRASTPGGKGTGGTR